MTESPVSKAFDFTTLQQCAYEYLDTLLDDDQHKGYQSGIQSLDRNMGGLRRGEVCILGGRTSQGKSMVALQWMYNVAMTGTPCLMISEEMSRRSLGERLISYVTSLSRQEIEKRHYDDAFNETRKFWEARAKCHVVNGVGTSGRAVEAIEHAVKYFGVEFVVVDYLQLLRGLGQTRYEQITHVSQSLKCAAVQNNVAMIALAQVGRDMERRDNVPRLSDLKESGQIEQDADQVVIVQWPHKSDPSKPAHEYRLYCLKNRNGPLNETLLEMRIEPMWQRIRDPLVKEQAMAKPNYQSSFDDFNNGREDNF